MGNHIDESKCAQIGIIQGHQIWCCEIGRGTRTARLQGSSAGIQQNAVARIQREKMRLNGGVHHRQGTVLGTEVYRAVVGVGEKVIVTGRAEMYIRIPKMMLAVAVGAFRVRRPAAWRNALSRLMIEPEKSPTLPTLLMILSEFSVMAPGEASSKICQIQLQGDL